MGFNSGFKGLSSTGKIFYIIYSNSFFWDYKKKHKIKGYLGM